MGRLKILVCAYREWAFDIVSGIPYDCKLVIQPESLLQTFLTYQPQIVLLLGWSWKVPADIYKKVPTICLHPSPLPHYRGGSPIQHQIMAGEKESAVTYFMVGDGIDDGPILAQEKISLEGSLDEIFGRITALGRLLLLHILEQYPNFKTRKQKGGLTYFTRRTPDMSELTPFDFKNQTAEELYNFVRALADPYPNAFVICADGKKLYIKEASLGT